MNVIFYTSEQMYDARKRPTLGGKLAVYRGGVKRVQEMTIYLEDGRRVKALEAQVAALEAEAAALREEKRVLEFRYRCESVVNAELLDLCREHGVKYRPSLKGRPWEDAPPMPPEGA